MTTRQEVSHLQSKLNQIEKEIDSIQQSCKHPSIITKFNKQNSVRVFCEVCDKELGMPTAAQVKDFLNIEKNN